MLKPDAVLRRLTGKILTRFEERGLEIVAAKMMVIPRELAQQHYAEHEEKPFFTDLVEYITSGPVLATVIEGEECITLIRKMVGATNPKEADTGTIRGDYAIDTGRNIIHASDSPASAEREIGLFFKMDEICDCSFPTGNGYRKNLNLQIFRALNFLVLYTFKGRFLVRGLKNLKIRSPIVSVLGHVDHGKPLSRLYKGQFHSPEGSRGITQHIGATEIPMEAIESICSQFIQKLRSGKSARPVLH